MGEEHLLIDRQLPEHDVAIAEHLIVGADPLTTWTATCELDLLTVHTPLMDAAMLARRVPGLVTRTEAPAPPELSLAAGMQLPGWILFGERPGQEIAFGAVGKFWQSNIEWRDVAVDEFRDFDDPGWGKIAVAFVTTPYGEHRTILTYDCRTATTDPESRRKFAKYWWLVRPFVAHIMRATLRAAGADAELRRAHAPEVKAG